MVTEYHPGGNLSNYIMEKVNFKEHEIVNIVRGILSAITYCHMNLKLIIGNLNPEGIVCDYKSKPYHTRVVSFNHCIEGSFRYVRHRMHKLYLDSISTNGDYSIVAFQALFLAPEQVLFGLSYDDNNEIANKVLSKPDLVKGASTIYSQGSPLISVSKIRDKQ